MATKLHNFAAITPNDNTPLTSPSEYLYVGVTGSVALVQSGDVPANAVILTNMQGGIVHHLPFAYSYVKATGTTATGLVQMH